MLAISSLVLLSRGLRQRCPVCGKGRIFQGWIKTYENCPVCGFTFEREAGYYTGAIAANLILTELVLAAVAMPVAASRAVSIPAMVALGLTLPILLPLLCYRPSKSIWMSFDHIIHPVEDRHYE